LLDHAPLHSPSNLEIQVTGLKKFG
jgi:hypothetical protein